MPRSAKPCAPVGNQLLAALTSQEYKRLSPYLEEFTLSFGEILYEPGQIIPYVYFPDQGIVSLLSTVDNRSPLEVGMVGNEGMVGISIFLGVPESLNRALVQGEGTAMRMSAAAFRKHIGQIGTMADMLRQYTYSLLEQISQSAVCNRFHKVNARLARWLLMTHDRLRSDEFRLTQEFLSHMLGVRREGVTIAARALQKAKLINYVRGQLTILDRAGLEAVACQCYQIVKLGALPEKAKKR